MEEGKDSAEDQLFQKVSCFVDYKQYEICVPWFEGHLKHDFGNLYRSWLCLSEVEGFAPSMNLE